MNDTEWGLGRGFRPHPPASEASGLAGSQGQQGGILIHLRKEIGKEIICTTVRQTMEASFVIVSMPPGSS